jgi:hypothetical protein
MRWFCPVNGCVKSVIEEKIPKVGFLDFFATMLLKVKLVTIDEMYFCSWYLDFRLQSYCKHCFQHLVWKHECRLAHVNIVNNVIKTFVWVWTIIQFLSFLYLLKLFMSILLHLSHFCHLLIVYWLCFCRVKYPRKCIGK